jgi:hypothetical protein
MDYFIEDNFVTNLEVLTLIDNINDTITFSNTVFIENSLETSNIICESLLSTDIFSSSVNTDLVTSDAATISNLSGYNVSSCNLYSSNITSHDILADKVETYMSATNLLFSSNILSSNLESTYGEINTLISSTILFLSQVYDRSNNVIIDSNSMIDWKYLKNLPENDEGLDIMNMVQSAYDLAQLGYDMYQQLQSLLGNTPKIPDNIKNPLEDALGSNDQGGSNIYVDWSKLSSRPIATNSTSYDIGFKQNMYVSDLSKIFTIPSANFSMERTNLYNTKTNSNMVFDFTNLHAFFNNFQTPFLSINSSNISVTSSNNINIGPVLLSSNNLTTSSASISSIINSNIYTYNIYNSSNYSNLQNLNINSSCNINIYTNSNGYFNVNSSNLVITKSNFKFIQSTSNANPFLDSVTTGLQINNSNIILKSQYGSNSSTLIQDYNQFTLNMSYSNHSSNLVLDSNLNVFGVNSLNLKNNINGPAISTSQCNLYVNSNIIVNSNIYKNGDAICSGVIRTNVIQLSSSPGLAVTKDMTPGIYGVNSKLLLSENDVIDLSDMISGTMKLNNTSAASWSSSYSKSMFKY